MTRRGEGADGAATRRLATLVAVGFGAALALAVEVLLRTSIGGLTAPATARGAVIGALVVGVAGAGLAMLGYRAAAQRAHLAEWVAGTDELLRSVNVVMETPLGDEPAEELIAVLLERVRLGCGASTATALLLSADGQELSVRVASGTDDAQPAPEPMRAEAGFLGRVIALGGPVVLERLEADELRALRRDDDPPGVAGCALVAHGEVLGVLLVGKTIDSSFGDPELRLLQLGADRLATALDRSRMTDAGRRSRLDAEHARRHVGLLSEASLVLASALEDHRPALRAVCRVLVPQFADLCTIDLINPDGGMESVAWTGAGDARRVDARVRCIRDVLATGRARLWFEGSGTDDVDEQLRDFAASENLSSVLIVPMSAGGISLGGMTLGTRPGRRGFRPSDLYVAEDLGGRTATAVERVQLYQSARASAIASAAAAARLRLLVAAELEISGATTESEVLDIAVANARAMLGAGGAKARYRAEDGSSLSSSSPRRPEPSQGDDLDRLLDRVCGANRPHHGGGTLGIPFVDANGANRGGVAVVRAGEPFAADEVSILVSLAQTAGISMEKAELYQAARRSETRLRAWFEASPLGIVELSPAGEVRRWNRAAAAMFGWRPERPGGVAPPAETLPPWFGPLVERAAAGMAIAVPVEPPGRYFDVSCVPLWEQPEHVDGVLLVVADTTERHRLEDQVHEAQRTEAVAALAGGVAHDFNNLLTVILGYTGLLIGSFEPDDRRRALLESVDRAGQRAATLTNQLLTIGRRQVAQPEVVDPSTTLAALREVIERVCGVDIVVGLTAEEAAGTVFIDPAQFEQIILNLVINARDAMPTGGRLDLVVRRGPEPEDVVVVEVRDTGEGMDAETLARCFEPFFTTKAPQHGTGLGLAAVRGIVSQAHGSVDVESRVGVGTTFRLSLPRAQRPVETIVPLERTAGPAGTERILLVEDEDEVRHLAQEILEGQGYTVLAAADAAEARVLLEGCGNDVDLLLTDIVLPGVRGTDLADTLTRELPFLRVLFMSGYAGGEGGQIEFPPGTTFLAKPFRPDELASRVREVLGESGLPQGSKR